MSEISEILESVRDLKTQLNKEAFAPTPAQQGAAAPPPQGGQPAPPPQGGAPAPAIES